MTGGVNQPATKFSYNFLPPFTKRRGIRMAKTKKVSRTALFARVNRRLAKQDQALRRCRENTRDHVTLGDLYVINVDRNAVVSKHVDLPKLAKRLGALKADEITVG